MLKTKQDPPRALSLADAESQARSLDAPGGDAAWPAIHLAALAGRADLVSAMLSHGAPPNLRTAQGATAALITDFPEVLSALIGAGADVDLADEDGWTPLMSAALMLNEELARILLQAGANPNPRSRDKKRDALMIAASRSAGYFMRKGDPAPRPYEERAAPVIALLLAHGADPEAVDAHGHRAADISRLNKKDASAVLGSLLDAAAQAHREARDIAAASAQPPSSTRAKSWI